MSSSQQARDDEVTFGAVINTPTKNQNQNQNYLAPNVFDTPRSNLSPVVTHESPMSPLYDAPSAQASFQTLPTSRNPAHDTDLEAAHKEGYVVSTNAFNSSSRVDIPTDLEPMSTIHTGRKGSFDAKTKECTMWPTKKTLVQQDRAERAKRRASRACGCTRIHAIWSGMDKRQRLWFKILIAAFVVAVAVGLGIGISKAVGAGVFAGKGRTKPIADP